MAAAALMAAGAYGENDDDGAGMPAAHAIVARNDADVLQKQRLACTMNISSFLKPRAASVRSAAPTPQVPPRHFFFFRVARRQPEVIPMPRAAAACSRLRMPSLMTEKVRDLLVLRA